MVAENVVEVWKPVVGWEEFYHVSNMGRVKRVKAGINTSSGRVLKDGQKNGGYRQVVLSRPGMTQTLSVHRVVMAAFVGVRPNGHHIDHVDGNKENNALSNLRYTTPAENVRSARHRSNNTIPGNRGETNPCCFISEQQVRLLVVLRSMGLPKGWQKGLARVWGIHHATVCSIANGRWRAKKNPHLPDSLRPIWVFSGHDGSFLDTEKGAWPVQPKRRARCAHEPRPQCIF